MPDSPTQVANPTAIWKEHLVSEEGYATAHRIGVGDINGDGKLDIVNPHGWWEPSVLSYVNDNTSE